MHEAAIVSSLIAIVEAHAARHRVTRVLRVRVKVGRLRAVEPQQLLSCFALFAEGTIAAGAELVIDEIEVRGRCRSCSHEFAVAAYRFVCPVCAGNDIEVTQGQELYIESFEADQADAASAASLQGNRLE